MIFWGSSWLSIGLHLELTKIQTAGHTCERNLCVCVCVYSHTHTNTHTHTEISPSSTPSSPIPPHISPTVTPHLFPFGKEQVSQGYQQTWQTCYNKTRHKPSYQGQMGKSSRRIGSQKQAKESNSPPYCYVLIRTA